MYHDINHGSSREIDTPCDADATQVVTLVSPDQARPQSVSHIHATLPKRLPGHAFFAHSTLKVSKIYRLGSVSRVGFYDHCPACHLRTELLLQGCHDFSNTRILLRTTEVAHYHHDESFR